MSKKYMIFASLCAVFGILAILYLKYKKKLQVEQLEEVESVPETETIENIFQKEWTLILKEEARTFNGLYNGLLRVQTGAAKKPKKVLREWCQRTHYKFEGQMVDELCQEHILPLIEAQNQEELVKWAEVLLNAAKEAHITKEESNILILTEENAEAYVEWDGEDIYPDDKVEVITPAWYQNGKVLEQGQCKIIQEN